jgi:hypothetical protein
MKKHAVLLVLTVLALGGLACGSGGGSGGGPGTPSGLSAGFTPDQPSPGTDTVASAEGSSSGELVTVEITLTDTVNVFGASFDLTYDADAADFVGWDNGDMFEQGSHLPLYNVSEVSNGQIVIGVTRQGSPPSVAVDANGTRTIIELTFRLEVAGSTNVQFQSNAILDDQPLPQPLTGMSWFAGSLTAD